MNLDRKCLSLYAVTDRRWLKGFTLYEQVKNAIEGGATFVQLREKIGEEGTCLNEVFEIMALCRECKVPFVINDHLDIALELDADGVHLGQSELNGDERTLLGDKKILGVSVTTVEQARIAETLGADYLGVGAMFHTNTKKDASYVELSTLKAICDTVNIPVIAIGGIDSVTVKLLEGSGISGIAVISAIFGQKNIIKATKELKKQVELIVM